MRAEGVAVRDLDPLDPAAMAAPAAPAAPSAPMSAFDPYETTTVFARAKCANSSSSAERAVRLDAKGVWRLRSLRVRVSHMISWPRQYVASPSRKW